MSQQTSSPNSSNENSPVSPPDEQGQGDGPPQLEEEEPAFPHTDLAKLDDMINRYALAASSLLQKRGAKAASYSTELTQSTNRCLKSI